MRSFCDAFYSSFYLRFTAPPLKFASYQFQFVSPAVLRVFVCRSTWNSMQCKNDAIDLTFFFFLSSWFLCCLCVSGEICDRSLKLFCWCFLSPVTSIDHFFLFHFCSAVFHSLLNALLSFNFFPSAREIKSRKEEEEECLPPKIRCGHFSLKHSVDCRKIKRSKIRTKLILMKECSKLATRALWIEWCFHSSIRLIAHWKWIKH